MAINVGAARAFSEANMPEALEVIRDISVRDDAGGSTVTPTTIATSKCRYEPLSGSEEVRAQRLESDASLKITCPLDRRIAWDTSLVTDEEDRKIDPADRLVMNGQEYEISDVQRGTFLPHLEILVTEGES